MAIARTSDPQIFSEVIFPKVFGTVAQESYMEQQETYEEYEEEM